MFAYIWAKKRRNYSPINISPPSRISRRRLRGVMLPVSRPMFAAVPSPISTHAAMPASRVPSRPSSSLYSVDLTLDERVQVFVDLRQGVADLLVVRLTQPAEEDTVMAELPQVLRLVFEHVGQPRTCRYRLAAWADQVWIEKSYTYRIASRYIAFLSSHEPVEDVLPHPAPPGELRCRGAPVAQVAEPPRHDGQEVPAAAARSGSTSAWGGVGLWTKSK